MDLGVAVLAGLGGGHLHDLAGTSLQHDESVLTQGGALLGEGVGRARLAGVEISIVHGVGHRYTVVCAVVLLLTIKRKQKLGNFSAGPVLLRVGAVCLDGVQWMASSASSCRWWASSSRWKKTECETIKLVIASTLALNLNVKQIKVGGWLAVREFRQNSIPSEILK